MSGNIKEKIKSGRRESSPAKKEVQLMDEEKVK